jgi:hypothetical protein
MDKLLETFKQTTQIIQQRNYIELNEKQRNEEQNQNNMRKGARAQIGHLKK